LIIKSACNTIKCYDNYKKKLVVQIAKHFSEYFIEASKPRNTGVWWSKYKLCYLLGMQL